MSTTITTEGNLTTDPELRFTKTTGQAVCTVRLAVNSRRKNIDGDYEDTVPVFYEATAAGANLPNTSPTSQSKGDRLLVLGTTHDEEWTDRDGNTRIKHFLQVTSRRRVPSLCHRHHPPRQPRRHRAASAPAEVG